MEDKACSGSGNCENSCDQKAVVKCAYKDNPNNPNSTTVKRAIAVKFTGNFSDRYERELKCAILKVQDCDWVLERIT